MRGTMKPFVSFLHRISVIGGLCFAVSVSGLAQEKNSNGILQPDASLDETYKWLEIQLKKNARLRMLAFERPPQVVEPRIKIPVAQFRYAIDKVEFRSCMVSFVVEEGYIRPGVIYRQPDPSRAPTIEPPGRASQVQKTKNSLELSEIDLNRIEIEPNGNDKNISGITFNTVENRKAIRIEFLTTLSRGRKPIFQIPSITIWVKSSSAEQIQAGFAHAIKLCRDRDNL
jgi:hypothetical protein